jgi:4-aminobutyrate aminotransferase-like enzyme
MIGVEFTAGLGESDKATAKAVIKQSLDDKLMILTCGTYSDVVR